MNDVVEKWFKKNTLSDLSQAINTFEGFLNFLFASESTQKKVILTDLDKYFFDKEKSELVMQNAISKNFSGFYRNVNYIKKTKRKFCNHTEAGKLIFASELKSWALVSYHKLKEKQYKDKFLFLTIQSIAIFITLLDLSFQMLMICSMLKT